MMAAEDGGEKTTTTCLATARYVTAAVVTVVLFMFIVRAVDVVFRPAELECWVQHGSVSVKSFDGPQRPDNMTFQFNLIVTNPSGRAGIYFNNNTVRLLRQSGGSTLQLLKASLNPIYMSPGSYSVIDVTYHKKNVSQVPDDDLTTLRNGSSFQAAVQVDAFFSYKIGLRNGTGGHDFKYCCWPVVVAVGGSSQNNAKDVLCLKTPCAFDQPENLTPTPEPNSSGVNL